MLVLHRLQFLEWRPKRPDWGLQRPLLVWPAASLLCPKAGQKDFQTKDSLPLRIGEGIAKFAMGRARKMGFAAT